MEKREWDPQALGISLGILGALAMLLLSIVGKLGYGLEAVRIMAAFHIGYSLSLVGIVVGMGEAAVASYVFGYLTAYLYNRFFRR
jgi:hypothetical protein